jgi:hypothetical protein
VLKARRHIPLGRPRERARGEIQGKAGASTDSTDPTLSGRSIVSSGPSTSLETREMTNSSDPERSTDDLPDSRASWLSTTAVVEFDPEDYSESDDSSSCKTDDEGSSGTPYPRRKGKQVAAGPGSITSTFGSRVQIEASPPGPAGEILSPVVMDLDVNLLAFDFGFGPEIEADRNAEETDFEEYSHDLSDEDLDSSDEGLIRRDKTGVTQSPQQASKGKGIRTEPVEDQSITSNPHRAKSLNKHVISQMERRRRISCRIGAVSMRPD